MIQIVLQDNFVKFLHVLNARLMFIVQAELRLNVRKLI